MTVKHRIIGLTGGIGCGKSTVAETLRDFGIDVVDADRLSQTLMRPGSWMERTVASLFPDTVVDGVVHRRTLGRRVFSDPAARKVVMDLMGPHIDDAFECVRSHLPEGIVVYDAPLFFEVGLDARIPESIVVFVDPDEQRARIRKRDPDLSDDDIAARISVQMPLKDKMIRATWLINNSGSRDDLQGWVWDLVRNQLKVPERIWEISRGIG